MSDELAKYPPAQVAGFYGRLADQVDKNKGALSMSLAAALMRQWLKNRDPKSTFSFNPPAHLTAHERVQDVLKFHRAVYLTQEKANFTGGTSKWAGIIPRLQGTPPHPKWNRVGAMHMEYQSLVEFPIRLQLTGSDADKDILYGLHGFQLKTNVSVTVQAIPGSPRLRLAFSGFQARVLDRYDWDYSEHLTVPNPDFGSADPGAIAPKSKTVVVYHTNAKRLEAAGLAAPYDLETTPWVITDAAIIGPAEVDPSRRL